jgi:hypothetical protein
LSEKIKSLNKLSSLEFGETIEEEDFDKLNKNLAGFFTATADGLYQLTQDALDFK